MRNSPKRKNIWIGIAAVLAIAAGVFLFLLFHNNPPDQNVIETIDSFDAQEAGAKTAGWGQEYIYNSDIRNILFLGVDKTEEMQGQEYAGRGGQADSIILLSVNTAEKTASMLNIPRDSMTDIDVYDMSGNYLSTEKAQLALQYAYGDGEKKSCWLMKKAVVSLLDDLPVYSYIALNIDGISAINDVLGGVEIYIPEDYTYIDEAFVKGTTLTLSGSQAEKYVRYRDITETGSNDERMERQNQFLKALVRKLKQKTEENPDFIDRLYSAGSPYMTTDMTVDEMKELTGYALDDTFVKIPGEIREGTEHDEFVVNYDVLKDMLFKLFYIQK